MPLSDHQPHNFTVTLGENLLITVANNTGVQPLQFSWQHNGYVLRNTRASFHNGTLMIEEIVLTDAGHYSLLLSDVSSCHSTYFNVYVECKLMPVYIL